MLKLHFEGGTPTLYKDSPADHARAVLKRHWTGEYPVDPGAIARALGIRVIPVDPSETPFPYSGYFTRADSEYPDRPVIRYSLDEPLVRRRFTVAHEIGHFVLGHEEAPRDPPSNFTASVIDPRERAANQFAAELLMPASEVRDAALSGYYSNVPEIAAAFGTSSVAMNYRLKNLGLTV